MRSFPSTKVTLLLASIVDQGSFDAAIFACSVEVDTRAVPVDTKLEYVVELASSQKVPSADRRESMVLIIKPTCLLPMFETPARKKSFSRPFFLKKTT